MKTFEQFTEIAVKSQYLHTVGLSVRPDKREIGSAVYTLRADSLPHIINPIESYLSKWSKIEGGLCSSIFGWEVWQIGKALASIYTLVLYKEIIYWRTFHLVHSFFGPKLV